MTSRSSVRRAQHLGEIQAIAALDDRETHGEPGTPTFLWAFGLDDPAMEHDKMAHSGKP
jgi:hypothetical protein